MISAERIMEYGQLESESPFENQPPLNWPDKGSIVMDKVSFKHADNLPLVLHSLSFSVLPSEKVSYRWCISIVG